MLSKFKLYSYSGGLIFWSTLGAYRGTKEYKYVQNRNKSTYLYVDAVGYGIYGAILYVNPFTGLRGLYKEAIRLEANIRNLTIVDNEYFNTVL